MLNYVYCMYDKVSEQYGPPILGINDNSLRREMKAMVVNDIHNNNTGFLSKRSDLVVQKIGTYDTDKGVISSCSSSQVFSMLEIYNDVLSEISVQKGDIDGSKK